MNIDGTPGCLGCQFRRGSHALGGTGGTNTGIGLSRGFKKNNPCRPWGDHTPNTLQAISHADEGPEGRGIEGLGPGRRLQPNLTDKSLQLPAGEGSALSERGGLGAGPEAAPGCGHEDDPAGRGQGPNRLAQKHMGVISLLKGMDQEDPVKRPSQEGPSSIINEQCPVAPRSGPGLDALAARHGRDHPTGPDKGIKPWGGITDPKDITICRLAPGILQTSGNQPPDQHAGGLAVEGAKIFDAIAHEAQYMGKAAACRPKGTPCRIA